MLVVVTTLGQFMVKAIGMLLEWRAITSIPNGLSVSLMDQQVLEVWPSGKEATEPQCCFRQRQRIEVIHIEDESFDLMLAQVPRPLVYQSVEKLFALSPTRTTRVCWKEVELSDPWKAIHHQRPPTLLLERLAPPLYRQIQQSLVTTMTTCRSRRPSSGRRSGANSSNDTRIRQTTTDQRAILDYQFMDDESV